MASALPAQRIEISRTGGPEVMSLRDIAIPAPGEGEIRVLQRAVGVNFVDIYVRTGLYPAPLPTGLGAEAAGEVEAVGPGVAAFKPGDRVAYATAPLGCYASARNVPAAVALKLPDAIDFETAAAMMLKGLTAAFLLLRAYPVKPGDPILLHAAAGGVGQILCQWAHRLGAFVIGAVGSADKAALARALGCDAVLLSGDPDLPAKVKKMTGGEGVAVVYDSVGKATFEASLDSLRPMGLMVSFGNASGLPPAIEPAKLGSKGSLFLTRPSLFHYCARRADLEAMAESLFAAVAEGAIKIAPSRRYALSDASTAHQALAARATTGSTILTP